MNFLIVDDDLIMRLFFNNVSTKFGHNCFMAENGLEALNLLKKFPIDVIVTDISMPIMDGVDLAIELKKSESKIPLFAITAGNIDLIEEEFPDLFYAVFSKMKGIEKIFKKILNHDSIKLIL